MGPGEFLNINFFTALFTLVNTVALFLVLKLTGLCYTGLRLLRYSVPNF
jgi:hypothetical protein